MKKRFDFEDKLKKAGINRPVEKIKPMMFYSAAFVVFILTFVLVYYFFSGFFGLKQFVFYLILLWTLGYIFVLIFLWLLFYFYISLRMFKRARDIEKVLADFLQIASANMRSGMSIEKALWYAVRPNFGVLAREIDIVAKEVMSGKELVKALQEFRERYDSKTLSRSINLLIEGIVSGGEIGGLLNKIANNIKETELMKKDMAANVTTYAIFITFASVVAAPLLFALSGQLLIIVSSIFSKINMPEGMSSRFPIVIEGVGLSFSDYQIFAVMVLVVTSLFSAIIVGTIKKGNAKYGVKYIAVYTAISLFLFFVLSKMMRHFFASMF